MKKPKQLYTQPQNRRLRKFLFRNKNVSNAEVNQIASDLGFKVKENSLSEKYDQSKIEKYAHEIATLMIVALVLILAFSTKCSAQNNDDIKHFYAVQFISHTSHDVCIYLQPKKPVKAFFIGLLTGIVAGEGKELIIDKYFGLGVYNKNDRIINYWSSSVYVPVRIVLNDIKKNKENNQLNQINEYEKCN